MRGAHPHIVQTPPRPFHSIGIPNLNRIIPNLNREVLNLDWDEIENFSIGLRQFAISAILNLNPDWIEIEHSPTDWKVLNRLRITRLRIHQNSQSPIENFSIGIEIGLRIPASPPWPIEIFSIPIENFSIADWNILNRRLKYSQSRLRYFQSPIGIFSIADRD